MKSHRVLLADDHANFLTVVANALDAEFDIVKSVGDGQSVVDEASKLDPDLIILDITMPALNGIDAARQLRETGFKGKIVFLTVHHDHDYVQAARAAGAQGYVVKNRLASDLIPAIRDVMNGAAFVSPALETI